MTPVVIAGRPVGEGHPPYIVAELSANHGGDLKRALRIIELAAQAGADAIKFQAYTADSLTLDSDGPGFTIEGESRALRVIREREVAAKVFGELAELGETAVGSEHYQALFTLGILLFSVTFFINLAADLSIRGVRRT